MDRSFEHQNTAPGDLGVFLDEELVGTVTANQPWSDAYVLRDRHAAEHGIAANRYEVLKLCPVHPDVSAVDCDACVPLD
jgi:hypothetical protein